MNYEGVIVSKGHTIGEWEVSLVGPMLTGVDRWSCTVRMYGDTTSSVIEHTYADGIAVLIGKCLMTHTEMEARKMRLKS